MKLFLTVLLVLALASPAAADAYGRIWRGDVVAKDITAASIVNTFFQNIGDCEADVIYTANIAVGDEPVAADTMHVAIGSGGMPGWLMLQIPEETNLTVAFVRFKESVSGATHSYTWGDWCPLYIGGEYREFSFNTGLWDSCHVALGGSGNGKVDVYYRYELISDD